MFKSKGTTPGSCKVAGSNLHSELVFRIFNYEFYYRNIDSVLAIPSAGLDQAAFLGLGVIFTLPSVASQTTNSQ